MLKYCIKRILLSIVILLGVSIILYTLVRCMPVSYLESQVYSNPQIENPEQRLLEMQKYYGLEPGFWNAIKGYFSWLVNLCHGDLGVSMVTGQAVEDVIFDNMGVSFGISLVALVLELLIAIPLGIKCACNQYGKLDYFATVLTMIGISFPRYSARTINSMGYAKDKGATIIAITDKDDTAMTEYADIKLFAKSFYVDVNRS